MLHAELTSGVQMLSSQEVALEADAETVVHRMPATAGRRAKAKAQPKQTSPDGASEAAARKYEPSSA